MTGENVIYAGGSFDKDLATFKNNAEFWGHIPGVKIKKFKVWIALVEGWDGDNTHNSAKIKSYRLALKQPPG